MVGQPEVRASMAASRGARDEAQLLPHAQLMEGDGLCAAEALAQPLALLAQEGQHLAARPAAET